MRTVAARTGHGGRSEAGAWQATALPGVGAGRAPGDLKRILGNLKGLIAPSVMLLGLVLFAVDPGLATLVSV
jgi:hypothetical protein